MFQTNEDFFIAEKRIVEDALRVIHSVISKSIVHKSAVIESNCLNHDFIYAIKEFSILKPELRKETIEWSTYRKHYDTSLKIGQLIAELKSIEVILLETKSYLDNQTFQMGIDDYNYTICKAKNKKNRNFIQKAKVLTKLLKTKE